MRKILFLLLFCVTFTMQAQHKNFQFSLGANYPIALGTPQYLDRSGVGFQMEGLFRLSERSSWQVGFSTSLQHYPTNYSIVWVQPEGWGNKLFGSFPIPVSYGGSSRTFSMMGTLLYNQPFSSWVTGYAGASMGMSADNRLARAVFNEGYVWNPTLAPRAGIVLWNHLDLSLQYYLTTSFIYDRLLVQLSYRF